ncbi:MAG: hypothetical protein IH588_02090 [Anaerolineales bacterium]|nr:hypothetical protein [Anaerolineales bacterium]
MNELSDSKVPSVIYDSQWCRFQIKFDGWEPPHQSLTYTIRIYYGRLHALNNKGSMIWKGEECYCWHGLWGGGEILNFLDGLSPSETANHKGWPRLLKRIREAELTKSLVEKVGGQPEQMLRTHRHIWEHYGQRLFELFDLRRPDLWEYYRQFLKEVYDIKGRNPNVQPPFDHVC